MSKTQTNTTRLCTTVLSQELISDWKITPACQSISINNDIITSYVILSEARVQSRQNKNYNSVLFKGKGLGGPI